jgi:hypothetical protein
LIACVILIISRLYVLIEVKIVSLGFFPHLNIKTLLIYRQQQHITRQPFFYPFCDKYFTIAAMDTTAKAMVNANMFYLTEIFKISEFGNKTVKTYIKLFILRIKIIIKMCTLATSTLTKPRYQMKGFTHFLNRKMVVLPV